MERKSRIIAIAMLAWFSSGWALAQGTATKTRDLCTVAPGRVAPALPARLLEGQGEARMKITTSDQRAQQFFNQGLAQMHSFWATEAERSFLQAAQFDPNCAMAYWGVAMVAAGDYRPAFQLSRRYNRPAREDGKRDKEPGISGSERARLAAEKAQALAASVSQREQMYIASVAARRNPATTSPGSDYIAALRKLISTYPDEIEAQTYLALALMNGYDQQKIPQGTTSESVALLRQVLARDNLHVGAHHYVIHALEGSAQPDKAWESCRLYPLLAPNIPHALHMPGHIYVQSDRWPDAAGAFEQSKVNEEKYMAADVLYGNGHYGHNVAFLISTYGFQQRYEDALATARELMRQKETPREAANKTGSSAYRQGWFGLMRTLVRFEKWNEILGDALPEDPRPSEQAWRHWARGLALAARGDQDGARQQLDQMKRALKERGKLGDVPEQLRAAKTELQGHIEVLGHPEKGIELLWKAARQEAELEYSEPPIYPRPALEALGQVAIRLGRTDVAEQAFRRALQQNPGSVRAAQGLEALKKNAAP